MKLSNEVKHAIRFAIEAHGGQMYGQEPYKYHLDKVAQNVRMFDGNDVHLQLAYLHDILEDTNISSDQMKISFGPYITSLVKLLTNTQVKERTFIRIRTHPDAVFVKLCDRLANVSEYQKIAKYRSEHELFRRILYRPGEFDELWLAIERHLTNPGK